MSALTLSVHSAVNQHNIHPDPRAGLDIPPLHAGKCGEGSVTTAVSQQQNAIWGISPMDKSQPGAAPSLDHLQLFLWRGSATGCLPFSCRLQLQDTNRTAAASSRSLTQIQPGKLTPAPAQRQPLPRHLPQQRFFTHNRRLFPLTLLKGSKATA